MIQVSPIRVQDGTTQAIVMALHDKPCDCPHLLVDFNGRQISVRLPIFVNRFLEAVEMPEGAFSVLPFVRCEGCRFFSFCFLREEESGRGREVHGREGGPCVPAPRTRRPRGAS